MRTIMVFTVLALTVGCSQHRSYVVEVNGRQVVFEDFREGKVPRGVEVTRVTTDHLAVRGAAPIEVNGMKVFAEAESLTVGGESLRVSQRASVRVREDGHVEVDLPLEPASAASTPAPQE